MLSNFSSVLDIYVQFLDSNADLSGAITCNKLLILEHYGHLGLYIQVCQEYIPWFSVRLLRTPCTFCFRVTYIKNITVLQGTPYTMPL